MIYFDNAATTYPKPEAVYNKMDQFYREFGVNAGRGAYERAKKGAKLIEDTRSKVASIFKAGGDKEVIFTPSATIAINLILQGLDWKDGDVIYYSPFEHNAVLRTLYKLEENYNLVLKEIPVNNLTLEFNLVDLEQMFASEKPRLVALSHVSNVCGVIAPVEEVVKLARKYGGSILVDGAQGAGLVPIDLSEVDYYVWTGHKTLYGPFGIAGVVVDKKATNLTPLIYGGTGSASEEREMPIETPIRYEAGSSNIQAIAGLNVALDWLEEVGSKEVFEHEKKLTLKLIDILAEFMDINLFIPKDLDTHFNVVAANFSGYKPHEVGKILDEKFDIAVRAGLHCSPRVHEFLGTMPNGLVRFSLGCFNTEEEVDKLKGVLDSFLI
ncbi:aminotransferase class V-fold PLP-dependent enzyme [Halonatronum saccharophilum]|uniref:aminotransferase class V-fold PLP-dependent enzyme n=1 Tax=Halonatronum saccharophilum TaxID=150060 RepID=UPI0004806E49|nr:aminotransferase class V-fold PLP-dependent enzyme [Halonatronum saccharophilum]